MSKPFPLIKVLEYRRHMRLEKRNALAAAMGEERVLQEQLDDTTAAHSQELDELGKLIRQVRIDFEAASQRRDFANHLEVRKAQLTRAIQKAQAIVEFCRRELVVADQEVKALERLQENFVAEQTFQAHKQAEIALAEQWQARHWAFGEGV